MSSTTTEKVNSIINSKGLKAWRISRGLDQNPFPIGNKYVYEIYLGRINKLNKRSILLLEDWLKENYHEE